MEGVIGPSWSQEVSVLEFLVRLFRRAKNVDRLRASWQANRTPRAAEALAGVLLERGNVDEALDVLKEAHQLFPRAERITTYFHHALRTRSSLEIRELRGAIAANGRPEVFARLAELYRYLGQFEDALEVAHEGLAAYPNSSRNNLAVGRVYYTRFLKTSSARDGRQAAEYLARSHELDRQNWKTLFHLANLHLTIGDRVNAEKHLELLRALIPGDSRINELEERLHALPPAPDAPETDYFSRYEARRLHAKGPREARAPRLSAGADLGREVHALLEIRGMRGVCVIDQNGRIIASVGEGTDVPSVQAAAAAMFEGARLNSRRMSIGTFKQGVLTCEQWRIFLYDIEGIGLALFGDATAREEQVNRRVADFVEECFCEAQIP
jgi:tetratricopeptide (TPR) repeat protein/predicted regulator of Ras-like GTPase activity (Roadblock/LC7/MglB family)